MKIKLSKTDWETIGNEMGWLKTAQAHPLKNDPMFGKIVDHNARASADSSEDKKKLIAEAHGIMRDAEESGYRGLDVNGQGLIVNNKYVENGTGRMEGWTESEPIRANTLPFGMSNGRPQWSVRGYNGEGEFSPVAFPHDSPTSPFTFGGGLRGEDINSDPSPSETARRMGM